MGPNLAPLLKNYWKWHIIVPKSVKCLGKASEIGRVVTQGDTAFPIIFNNVVNVRVRAVLDMV